MPPDTPAFSGCLPPVNFLKFEEIAVSRRPWGDAVTGVLKKGRPTAAR
jgi:hypothetical protein